MAKYINKFDTVAQYNVEKDNLDYPSINYVVETDSLEYYAPATPSEQYLTFVAREDGTFSFTNAMSYSLDSGTTWATLEGGTSTPTIASGETVMWKGELVPVEFEGIGYFSSTGQFDVQGNPMSLLFGDNFKGVTDLTGKNSAFGYLFSGCTTIVNAENLVLPATTLVSKSYYYMFYNCTSLTTPPELPATTLADHCYQGMFYGCESLTTAPELPATTLADWCYSRMFRICTSLTTAPELPATNLAIDCYERMFGGSTSLETAPELPATTLASACYSWMFNGCTSLTTAPELLATTLAKNCYSGMFNGCSSLNYVKCLATDISANNCTNYWLENVASTGTFVKAAGMNDWGSGSDGIPENWSVEDAE